MAGKVQSTWQVDDPFSPASFFILPKHIPGRVNTDDFVYFSYPASFPAHEYFVVTTTQDTSGSPLRQLGKLEKNVELPHVQFGAHGKLYLIPSRNEHLPTFYARLNRGSTYVVPEIPRGAQRGDKIEMLRHGVLTAGVQDFSIRDAY